MNLVKHLLILSMLFLTHTTTYAEGTPNSIKGTVKIKAEDIFKLVEKYPNLVIVDSRKTSDRMKGYIEGSVGLPDTKTTRKSLAKAIPTKGTPVVFYCNGEKCGRSVKSSKLAVSLGYKNVYWFRGGWEEWENKGLPVAK
ncbi:MAG: rhodanese-like domain-containing protein [Gammaproteobacteria bacterium]|nr:rhodanese-like domain-containing protein [Gammaproteobacteria bacterium]